MIRVAVTLLVLAAAHALTGGCGDVTGDLIVRAAPPQEPEACTSDAGCAPPWPRCELATGTCVACLDDDDCPADDVCALPANTCAERCTPAFCSGSLPVCDLGTGSCRACGADAECPAATSHCLASGACVECLDNSDCRTDEDGEPLFCGEAGRCVECLDDGHCDDVGERCSAFLGECAEPCSAAEPCSIDDPICDESIGFCVECRTDLDCDDDALCRRWECVD